MTDQEILDMLRGVELALDMMSRETYYPVVTDAWKKSRQLITYFRDKIQEDSLKWGKIMHGTIKKGRK